MKDRKINNSFKELCETLDTLCSTMIKAFKADNHSEKEIQDFMVYNYTKFILPTISIALELESAAVAKDYLKSIDKIDETLLDKEDYDILTAWLDTDNLSVLADLKTEKEVDISKLN